MACEVAERLLLSLKRIDLHIHNTSSIVGVSSRGHRITKGNQARFRGLNELACDLS